MTGRAKVLAVASTAGKMALDLPPPLSHVAALLAQLAQLTADQLPSDDAVPRLRAGDEVELVLVVRATVAGVQHDDESLAYELELERRDYVEGRTVSVDHDEIRAVKPLS